MENIFFDNWQSILRAFVITVLGYGTLVLAIRISGKRTLAKMNAFDFIVTIALGSCLASVSLNKSVALSEGIIVYATLIGLQFSITWLSVRFNQVKVVIGGKPTLLAYKGKILAKVLKAERITMQEIYVACRANSIFNLDEVEVIVLETTGDITVISKPGSAFPAQTLEDVVHSSFDKTE
ncbi:DUF421 domain-containing protein [Pedobacter endophyticus]|uniref:DUF421 domain-containing protein n=1 Tax=Pedobacter endophyticus TaxID=2789740 RepID=A0A7U3SQ02_9SPHI|nr:YetF domain-containing protein [Pedobacter endophyticus]QPH38601.1 DUF421 domain-containing protein [Pedobacter endophyticus]